MISAARKTRSRIIVRRRIRRYAAYVTRPQTLGSLSESGEFDFGMFPKRLHTVPPLRFPVFAFIIHGSAPFPLASVLQVTRPCGDNSGYRKDLTGKRERMRPIKNIRRWLESLLTGGIFTREGTLRIPRWMEVGQK